MQKPAGFTRGLVAGAAMVVIAAGLKVARGIAVPILMALFIAFVSAPLVFRLTRRGVPHWLAVVLVLLAETTALALVGLLVGSSLQDLRDRLPVYGVQLTELTRASVAWLEAHGAQVGEDVRDVDVGAAVSFATGALSGVGSAVVSGALALILASFTLFDAARLWRQVDRHFSSLQGESLLNEISHEMNRYIAVKAATSLVTGVLAGLACAGFGVDFPVLWGLLAFALNFIPTIGSILAAIPPVLIALVLDGPWNAALLTGIYLAINGVVGNVIEPRVMGQALGVSPVVVLMSVIVCGYVLGPIGALLSVPLTMILKIALSSHDSTAWVARLMGGRDEEGDAPPPEPTGRLSRVPDEGHPRSGGL